MRCIRKRMNNVQLSAQANNDCSSTSLSSTSLQGVDRDSFTFYRVWLDEIFALVFFSS
jgi:hypothetical protein